MGSSRWVNLLSGGTMAAAAIAAAASQKDMGWYKTGSVKKKPALDDPLQLYSLCEVVTSEGDGPEAVLTVKVVESYYDDPVDFLPQGGGVKKGEILTVTRANFHAANPPEQDMVMDLGELDNMHEPGLLHCMGMRYKFLAFGIKKRRRNWRCACKTFLQI